MPLHPKTKNFAASGLFAGLSSFGDLEQRIAAIPENKMKGDAFEVFAEAYLNRKRNHDAKQVWPLSAAPLDLLGQLGLGGVDNGVDGVLETRLGDYCAYQVKFRANREAMTWRELSTFMGLADSPHIRSRILITNCDDLPAVINERQGFFCIRGSDLDRMDASDFQAIEAWLAETVIQATLKRPLPHQEEALAAIIPALERNSRATAIMACGTGKTLVTLWTMERLGARKSLVLLPSLALLKQTLHEWLKETNLGLLAYLCVCSDPTVKGDADEVGATQADLDFEVSTNPEVVRRFLDAQFKGTKIIFSTYQSASVIGLALSKGETFDLGIFDEAHKTSGREGRNYSYALEDSNISIRRRLFVTATPRHYNISRRNKEDEATLAFSMDDPKIYGEQCYTLSFSKAASLGIICGYKVIISVITSDQVNHETLSRGVVQLSGDEVKARQAANQIALRDAVNEYGVGKVFTFHSTVKSAESFVADSNEGVRTHLPAFNAFHVSGAMPTARRERLMREFKRINRAVMSNARCLTEGVDVPAVDMVAFLSPKKSKVDILQAIGRAMRKSEGKEIGYVLVPIFLEQREGETLEEAVARTDFEEVWDILHSLKEQDEVLADIIREMSEAKGRGKGFSDNRLNERIDFTGPVLSLETLRASIIARTLERLESSWDLSFGQLCEYAEQNGNCRVPKEYEPNKALGNWVGTQRVFYVKGKLSKDRISRLEAIGFEWDPISKDWEINFAALKAYKDKHGDCRASQNCNKTLGNWVMGQRTSYAKGKLSQDRISRLEALGFQWDPYAEDWELNFAALKVYKEEHGDCRVPWKYKCNRALATWVAAQRARYAGGKLPQDRISSLEAIGFEWDPISKDWEMSFAALKAYKDEHGDCRASQNCNKTLGNWVMGQRTSYAKGKLSQDRISRLEALGFQWDPNAEHWELNFIELKAYKEEHGDCRVPAKYKLNPALGNWVGVQRNSYAKGTLTQDRISRLEALDFQWDPNAENWELNFAALKAYKEKHGDCRVPKRYKPNQALATWVGTLRSSYLKGKLPQDRISRLEALGFQWDPRAENWEVNFAAVKVYKEQHGNCRVPKKNEPNRALGNWVRTQRALRANGMLPQDRISRLDDIDFEWKVS